MHSTAEIVVTSTQLHNQQQAQALTGRCRTAQNKNLHMHVFPLSFELFLALNICVSMFVNVQYAHCAVSFFSFCLSFITTYSPKLQLTPEAISVYLDSMSAFHTGIIRAI